MILDHRLSLKKAAPAPAEWVVAVAREGPAPSALVARMVWASRSWAPISWRGWYSVSALTLLNVIVMYGQHFGERRRTELFIVKQVLCFLAVPFGAVVRNPSLDATLAGARYVSCAPISTS